MVETGKIQSLMSLQEPYSGDNLTLMINTKHSRHFKVIYEFLGVQNKLLGQHGIHGNDALKLHAKTKNNNKKKQKIKY